MIQEVHSRRPAPLSQPVGELQIVQAGGRVAAGMRVEEQEARRPTEQRWTEELAG